jgi:geranylgeranyl pyrophosphate synthase
MKELLEPIQADLIELEKYLVSFLETGDSFQDQISAHIFHSGGKRVRPSVFLLFANALGWNDATRFAVAAAFEYIHTASLLHDDVIDSANIRRNCPTVNAQWTNTIAILAGDRINATASRLIVRAKNFDLFDHVSETIQMMSDSEIFQLTILWKNDTSYAEYRRVVEGKTARLFETAAIAAARIINLPTDKLKFFADYGNNLGYAFQIVDDCLDFDGSENIVGKPLLADLLEGKITLPLILACEAQTPLGNELRNLTKLICEQKTASTEQLQKVRELVIANDGVQKARAAARKHAEIATESLHMAMKNEFVANSNALHALGRIPQLLTERNA